MSVETNQLHVAFFPMMVPGHMIPTIDMTKLFAAKGVRTTIITTPLNAPIISKTIETATTLDTQINVHMMKFPSSEAGLPEGSDARTSNSSPEFLNQLLKALYMLQEPLEEFLQQYRPNCLVADMFFPWATKSAAKYGIPRLVFNGSGFFSMCATECLRLYEPHKKVSSTSDPFLVPSLPGEIKLTLNQMPDLNQLGAEFVKLMETVQESNLTSYGVVFNSFYELEPDYADYYKKVLGRKAWHIGPVSLCNKNANEKALRGRETSLNEQESFLNWLASKPPNSVIYVCFGSLANFTTSQLKETAAGLEASGKNFIWVIRNQQKVEENGVEDWSPDDFISRIGGRGLIVEGWAPQVLILEHEAIGGFVTHCGWNSILEGVSAGVPMVTWPLTAEQLYNEKLVTEVLRIGISVGVKKWGGFVGDSVKREAIQKAIEKMMVGEEAEEIRKRAKMFGELARMAMEEGGSSCSDLNALLEELKMASSC